jgi:thiopeptide-type bacteriocin biosynthesis protein
MVAEDAQESAAPFSREQLLVDGRILSLTEFLDACARSLADGEHGSQELLRVRDRFLRGGLTRVRCSHAPSRWLQRSLVLASPASPALYEAIERFAVEQLGGGLAVNAFFVHKPPGLRLRFEAGDRQRDQLTRSFDGELARWLDDGLLADVVPGVYEPETTLFGGPRSMSSVHATFTLDSLAWLRFHAAREPGSDGDASAMRLSLAMIRALLDGLEIVDWEDIEVWDRLRTTAGRRIAPEAREHPGFRLVAAALRRQWRTTSLRDDLTPPERETVERFRVGVAEVTRDWRSRYFGGPDATIGPREASAYVVMFHWNRAALSMFRQALIAESLAHGPDYPG